MEINQHALNKFADLIPDRVRKERQQIVREGTKFADKPARENFNRAVNRWFCEHFGVENSKDYVFV
ncbi:MAG: hypothetical protein ABSF65_12150 [Candidatus Bathyarchaeia archaeon]|jgi:hypothetical protein